MIWLLYILCDSIVNWYLIEIRKIKPFYFPMNLIRGIFAIVYGGLVLNVQDDWSQILLWVIQVALPFPFLFNTLLNTWRRTDLDYMGAESGWIDSFMVKHNKQRLWYWVSLIMFLIAFKTL